MEKIKQEIDGIRGRQGPRGRWKRGEEIKKRNVVNEIESQRSRFEREAEKIVHSVGCWASMIADRLHDLWLYNIHTYLFDFLNPGRARPNNEKNLVATAYTYLEAVTDIEYRSNCGYSRVDRPNYLHLRRGQYCFPRNFFIEITIMR